MDFQSNPMTSLGLYQLFMNLFPSQRQLTHVPGAFFINLREKSYKFRFEEFLACGKWLTIRKYLFFSLYYIL